MAASRRLMDFIWGETGDKSEPSAGEKLSGWTPGNPLREQMNFIQDLITEWIQHSEQNGIVAWDTGTTYNVGALTLAVVDSKLYQSQLEQSGNEPSVDGGTNWLLFGIESVLASSGRITHPIDGWSIQWGTENIASNTVDAITLPKAYTTAQLWAVCAYKRGGDNQSNCEISSIASLSQLSVFNDKPNAEDVFWMSIGH